LTEYTHKTGQNHKVGTLRFQSRGDLRLRLLAPAILAGCGRGPEYKAEPDKDGYNKDEYSKTESAVTE
jgi:hypothetical protein